LKTAVGYKHFPGGHGEEKKTGKRASLGEKKVKTPDGGGKSFKKTINK